MVQCAAKGRKKREVEESWLFLHCLSQLQLDLRHRHQGIDFVLGPLEVLNAEGIDGNNLHAGLVADL